MTRATPFANAVPTKEMASQVGLEATIKEHGRHSKYMVGGDSSR